MNHDNFSEAMAFISAVAADALVAKIKASGNGPGVHGVAEYAAREAINLHKLLRAEQRAMQENLASDMIEKAESKR